MAILETKYRDLLDAFDANEVQTIIHGCNCFRSFGAGIAKSIKERYPKAYEADLNTGHGDKNKLGHYSYAKLSDDKTIINAYTQYAYGGNKVNVDYDAISKVFELINKDFANHINIGIPTIGAGLAGGDWNIISDIINKKTPDLNITLYIL